MAKKDKAKPNQTPQSAPKLDGDRWHQKHFYSTKPPHGVIRSVACDCDAGQQRGSCSGGYESPGK